jgi:Rv0078B-related antitoxin
MDPLVAHDIQVDRETPPAQKLAQALELMETGFGLKRAGLRAANPEATEAEIEQAFVRWLLDDA